MESDGTCHASSAEGGGCSDSNIICMEEDIKPDVSALLAIQISDLSGALLDHTYARSDMNYSDGKPELKEEDSMVNDVNLKSRKKGHSFKRNKNSSSDTLIQNRTGISETVFPQDDMDISESIYSNIQIKSNAGEFNILKMKCSNRTSNEIGIINKCNQIRSINSISTRERNINNNSVDSIIKNSLNNSTDDTCDSRNPTENSNLYCDSRNSPFRKHESTHKKSEDKKPVVSSLPSAQSNINNSSNIRIEIGGVMVKEEDIKPDVTSLLPVVSFRETDTLNNINHTTDTTAEKNKASKVVNRSMLKPFGCNVCGETYASLSCLKKHARTHGSEKPLVCTICGAKFIRKSLFVEHQRSHSYMMTNLKSYLQRIPKPSEV